MVVDRARGFGRLRRAAFDQAPTIRVAAAVDRRVLPRWQRDGDGHHEWAHPGAYREVTSWSSRVQWLDVVVPTAIRLRPDVLEQHHVSAEMLQHWADTVSLFAHRTSGRRCIVRPDRLAELMQCAKRTVQRCQKAAEELGLYVIVTPGRMLTEEEVRRVRERGSRQRGLSNDAALAVPAWLQSEILSRRSAHSKSDVTPTSGRALSPFRLTPVVPLEPRSAGETEPPSAARQQRRGPGAPPRALRAPERPSGAAERPSRGRTTPQRGPRRVYDPDALQLARDLVGSLQWLTGVSPGRLEPGLRRFVRCRVPWSVLDIITAIDASNRRNGRAAMTRSRVKHPVGLLAKYLRDFDADADHPLGPDYRPDPTRPRRTALSPVQVANVQRLEDARARRAAADPARAQEHAQAARDAIRAARPDPENPDPHTL